MPSVSLARPFRSPGTLAAASLLLSVAGCAPPPADGFNGTWVLRPERSIGPVPRSESLTLVNTRAEQRQVMDYVGQNGQAGHIERTIPADGSATGPGSSGAETVTLARPSATVEVVVTRRRGAVVSTLTRLLVDDGRTLLSINRSPDGTIQWVRVFTRGS